MHNDNACLLLIIVASISHLKQSDGGFACLSNPCVHGVCLDDLNTTYACYCIDGYTGIQCQTNWDECWSNPCQNGGVCQDGIAAFNCTCPSGFAGDLCEENLNECLSSPCLNNATCLDAANGYVCNCAPGYSGVHCEQDVAVCNLTSEARCANGGVCLEGPGFTFHCRCLDGWMGLLCELEVDECLSHPCQNGAVCVDLRADYECACPFGYAGRNCEETVLICEDSPCKNNALCLMEEERPVCYCVPDYHGERCQHQYDECKLTYNRCLNGGSCIDGVDGFTCSCPPRITGVYCECLIVELRGSIYLECNLKGPTPTTINTTRTTEMVTFTDSQSALTTLSIGPTPSIIVTAPTETTEMSTTTPPSTNVPNKDLTSTSTEEMISTITEISEETSASKGIIFPNTTIVSTTLSIVDTTAVTSEATFSTTEATTEQTSTLPSPTTSVTTLETLTTEVSTVFTTEVVSGMSTSQSTCVTIDVTNATTVETTHVASSSTDMKTTDVTETETEPESQTTNATIELISTPDSFTFTTLASTTEDTDNTYPSPALISTSTSTMTTTMETSDTTIYSVSSPSTKWMTGFPLLTDFVSTTTEAGETATTILTTTFETSTELGSETTSAGSNLPFDCSKLEQACLNGGTCIFSEGFRCACLYDFVGERCDTAVGITNAAFNGRSYILHKMQTGSRMEVAFVARSTWKSGVLFYASLQDTYMALYMEHAHLKFKFSCGHQTMLLSEVNKAVNDGNSMRISALLTFSEDREHCNASIKLNDTLTMSGAQISNGNNVFDACWTLFLGGLNDKSNAVLKLPGFIGCMSDLFILSEAVRIFGDAEDAFGVSECSSLACLSNPCKNGATCTALQGKAMEQYYCTCTNGYVGAQCEKSVCDNNPCQFGGTCLPFTGSGYLCLCPYGKHGHFCENDLKISKAYYSASVEGYASFTSHPIPQSSYKYMYIKFKITPIHLNQIALLMFIGQQGQHDFYSHHMAVSFVKGFIMLTWNLGSGPRRIFTSKPVSADRANYEIQVGRLGRRAWLYVEHIGNVTGRSYGTLSRMDVEPFIYFGGYKSKDFAGLPHDLPLHSGFAGCIFDMELKIESVAIALDNGHITGRAVGQCGTTECYEGVCQNHGVCLYHGGTFTCMCQDGFYGPLCSNKFNLCQRNSCAAVANCVPMIAGYECDCPLGRKGKYCQQNETLSDISFTGIRSYLSLAPRHFEANKFNFDLELRPFQDGLVAFIGNDEYYFSLSLLSGLLELRILPSRPHNNKHKTIILRSNKLMRFGTWHQVKIQVYGRKIHLFVDHIVNTAIMQPHDSIDLSNEEIHLGGLPDMSLLPQDAIAHYPSFYKGCLRKLFINTVHVVLHEALIVRAQNVQDCDGTPCGGDYCLHGGTCWLDPNLHPHCNCLDPYYGDKCQRIYDCLEHNCKNDGYCLGGRCVCKVGFVGALCETGLTIRRPKFVGRSYLYVNVSSSYPHATESGGVSSGKKRNSITERFKNITINFLTASDGLILFANIKNGFAIGLHNGKLTVQNGSESMQMINSLMLSDGLEHEMLLTFSPFRIYVDARPYGVGNFSNIAFDDFYLGGIPNNVSWFNTRMQIPFNGLMFDGCINTITTNNVINSNIDFNTYTGENIYECSSN